MAELADDRTIYFVGQDGELVPMRQHPYDSELLLQELLAHHPSLLGGGRDNSRWLLVTREMPVPDRDAGGGRWSLDHLFVDDQAVPTLVEVKRSSDSRIRREVIGQLLDYAANGVEYWPQGEMRRVLEQRLATTEDALTAVSEVTDMDPEDFWEAAESNLRSGRVRLVVLADVIPRELRRIVEFLNERMPDTEILAMEVRQYVGEGRQQTLVPRIIGDTTTAQRTKERDRGANYPELMQAALPETRQLERLLQQWTEERNGDMRPARTSMAFWVDGHHVVRLYPVDNTLEFMLQRIRTRGLVEEAASLKQELQRLCPNHRLSDRHLYLPTSDLIRNWSDFTALLERYLHYLEVPTHPESR